MPLGSQEFQRALIVRSSDHVASCGLLRRFSGKICAGVIPIRTTSPRIAKDFSVLSGHRELAGMVAYSRGASPSTTCRSARQMPQAETRTRISSFSGTRGGDVVEFKRIALDRLRCA